MNYKTPHLEPEKWMDRYYDYLTSFARKRISDPVLVEDIIQETFLAALKSKFNFNGKSVERTWLTSILKHKIIDSYRKSNSRSGRIERTKINISDYEDFYLKENDLKIFECQSTDYNIIFQELNYSLEEEIKKLSPKESNVFLLKFLKRYETEAICEELGISRDYCWVLIHRARKKIYNSLMLN
ncbi:sigma-70 family RNA polymerase sigma factor [uncultured Aquimarina sp.]|uniref:RNA polymerase sigma factor n=1 Tax=uncultured Aquimarina sp. TaxID=575652 RepID=UPI00262EFCBE|nr:sigma-70 family RNA polymerase sigma factor [uncultured Aquimarina sp.]